MAITKKATKKAVAVKAKSKLPVFVSQYQAVLDSRQKRFEEYFDENSWLSAHETAHIRLLEIERLYEEVKGRREYRLLALSLQLLADGLCSVACASYQLAFFSLRSFLETSTAAIRFSAFEFELRHWELGTQDIFWAAASAGDKGVYSKVFAAGFFPPLAAEQKHYEGLAARVYREASEYVHSNPSSHADAMHSDKRIKQWFSLFDAATTCIVYAFFVRYNSDMNLSNNTNPDVVAVIQSDLGHFPSVSDAIAKADM